MPALLFRRAAKACGTPLSILLIVWTAILLYQVGNEANAFAAIRKGLRQLLPNQLLQLLAIGWVFESFLQGITGFGVPVAVGAPLLIGIGVQPLVGRHHFLIGTVLGEYVRHIRRSLGRAGYGFRLGKREQCILANGALGFSVHCGMESVHRICNVLSLR